MRNRWKTAGLLLAFLLVLAVALQHESQEGFFAPVFSGDGFEVLYIHRHSTGFAFGPGWEGFSPPARVLVLTDRFSIRSIDLASRRDRILFELPRSPIERSMLSNYRTRLFGTVSAFIRRPAASGGEVGVSISLPRQPATDYRVFRAVLDRQAIAASSWRQAPQPAPSGSDAAVLHGALEVLAVPGPDAAPCGIAVHDSRGGQFSFIKSNKACTNHYGPDGLPLSQLSERLQRPELERIQRLQDAEANLKAEALARGLPEGQAALHVIDRMRELGYYPKPERWVAEAVAPSEADALRRSGALSPFLRIEEMEFTVGLFPDLDQAIRQPGSEVEKSMGSYIRHRDYSTSEALNRLLASGVSRIFVERAGKLYRLELLPREPAAKDR